MGIRLEALFCLVSLGLFACLLGISCAAMGGELQFLEAFRGERLAGSRRFQRSLADWWDPSGFASGDSRGQ